MDLQELVRAFNKLPRSPKTPSGLVDDHWHFTVRHVPLKPPGDLLHLVNPPSEYTHTEGPAQILSIDSTASRADVVLPMLLRTFVNNMGVSDPRFAPRAPWSWGTGDEDLAKELERKLKQVGVRSELCTIKVGDEKSMEISDQVWIRVFENLQSLAGPKCTQCTKAAPNNGKLQVCGRCKTVQYCSKDCQKANWKEHKAVCKYIAKDPSVDAIDYYQMFAPHSPEAQSLAAEIGLSLPGSGVGPQGLTYVQPFLFSHL